MPKLRVQPKHGGVYDRTSVALQGLPLFDVAPDGGTSWPKAAVDALGQLPALESPPVDWDAARGAARAAALRRRESQVGLSTCNNQPQVHYRPAKATIALGGNLIRVIGPELPGDAMRAKRKPGTVRGKVGAEFSPSSRRYLLRELGAINQSRLLYKTLMVTLTYPETWPGSPAEWKKNLLAFVKRVLRRYPGAAGFWRLEPQARGAPHFHLIIFNVRYLPFDWVGAAWADITAGNAAACSETRRARSYRGVMSYAAKYMAKVGGDAGFTAGPGGEVLSEVGRLWGKFNADGLPVDLRTYTLTMDQFYPLRRQIFRKQRADDRARGVKFRRAARDATSGVTVFMDWFSAAQLVSGQLVAVRPGRLALDVSRMEHEARYLRELLSENWYRQKEASSEGGRE
jgi:hypothetical protein